MTLCCLCKRFGLVVLMVALASSAEAQLLEGASSASTPKRMAPAQGLTTPAQSQVQPQDSTQATPNVSEGIEPPEVFFIPEPKVSQVDRPTLDGVKRGKVSMAPIVSDDAKAGEDDELIFLYYKDFKVDRMLSGRVTCNVTFVVTTTLNRKLSNVSARLVWPNLTTTLSFDDVIPNTDTQLNYTLMGEGCFSLDKVPNIVVNRCRVKGLTQSQCASKIRWLSK